MNEAKEMENQVVEQNNDSEEKNLKDASENEVKNEEKIVKTEETETTSSSEENNDEAKDESGDEKSLEEEDVVKSDSQEATASEDDVQSEETGNEETATNTEATADDESDQSDQIAENKEEDSSDEEQVAESETEEESSIEKSSEEKVSDVETTEQEDKESGEATQPEEDLDVPEELTAYLEIVQKASKIADSSDWQYASLEFDNLRHKWSEGPDVSEEQEEIYNKLNDRFQQSLEDFNERKSKHYDELNRQKLKNLERKKDLLERLEKIIDNKKWHASNEVKGIQKRWDNIKMLPSGEGGQLINRYKQLLNTFEENRVEYLVQRKQKEEDNLQVKLLILDKMEMILKKIEGEIDDWNAVEKEYQELQREWKKVGRVPRDKSGELWQRYKAVRSGYFDKKLENNEEYRKQVESNINKKLQLCEQAENLLEKEDLASSARTINKLHKRWKETGPVPRDKAEELWDRFKAASDAFNKKKSENIELLRAQEKENYEAKLLLCTRAEEIQSTEDWKGGTRAMQDLMEEWKEIGPVPRRKTRKIWKRFKKAMDVFYQRKRDYYKQLRVEQRENLKKKREVIEKLRALGEMEDAQEAVKKAKPLQAEFAKIGYVPLKHKNKIYKHYREACDVIYQRSRAERAHGFVGGENSNLDPEARKQLKKRHADLSKLRKQCNELKETILKYQDSKTFIKPNKKGMKLREEIQSKIDDAEKKLENKLDKIDEIRQEIDTIKNQDENGNEEE